ncbi:MAG TPA: NAD-dependent epimerase/dehydratase family protein [Candidatus Paceibacterota bacterium]
MIKKIDNNKGVKVVVTGGAGFIGSHIADALIAEGYEVHIIDNLSAGKMENINPKAVFHKKDIRNLKDIAPIIKGAKYVFHEAAIPRVPFSIEHPNETNEANVTGTLNVLTAARDGKVKRLIYAASSSAYGDQKTLPLVESMEAKPKSPYGLQKYIGELYAKLFSEIYDLETVSLRYFNVYGPRFSAEGAYALVIGKFIDFRKKGKPMTITGDGTQTRDFTNIHDIVRANLLAMKSKNVGKGEVMNIGAGRNFSVNQVAELIGGPTVHIASRLEPHDTLASNALAKKLIGWTPKVKLEEGIEELRKVYKF